MRVVVGVTGGIAAYKAVQVVRLLVQAGHDVHVVPTDNALRFVGLPTWEAISRNPVTTSLFDGVSEVRHVQLGQTADLVIVAPATADALARMAAGIASDLLGTTLLATRAPVLVAPAMHTEMWEHPATVDNVGLLRSRGVHVVGPAVGQLTGSDSGPGRMSEPEEIVARAEEILAGVAGGAEAAGASAAGLLAGPADGAARVEEALTVAAPPAEEPEVAQATPAVPQDLAGVRVLITAGGTREPIDPVRFIGNRSSGRQGVELALAAQARGAKVVLLAANVEESLLTTVRELPGVRVVQVSTAAELREAAHAASGGADIVVMAAAVSDFRVEHSSATKLRKEELRDTGAAGDHIRGAAGGADAAGAAGEAATLSLQLVENPDILRELCESRRPGQVVVGFAAETVDAASEEEAREALLALGRAKLARKGADLLAVNRVGESLGFESGDNAALVLAPGGEVVAERAGSKREVADTILSAAGRVSTGRG